MKDTNLLNYLNFVLCYSVSDSMNEISKINPYQTAFVNSAVETFNYGFCYASVVYFSYQLK